MLCILLSGCTNQPQQSINETTPTPEITLDSQELSAKGDLIFCKEEYCYVMTQAMDAGSIEAWMNFFNAMDLSEITLNNQNQLVTLSFDEHKVIFYEQDIVDIDGVVYQINNADQLRGSNYAYKFSQINPEIFFLSDYINESNLKGMGISYMGGYTMIEFKDDTLKKELVEELSQIVVLDPGNPEYGAGGYGYELLLNNGSILEENGVHLYINSEKLTTKQSSCFNGSIAKAIVDLLIKQGVIKSEDETGTIIDGFETNQLKGYPADTAK